jgi:type 1 glutamine amidotransferase
MMNHLFCQILPVVYAVQSVPVAIAVYRILLPFIRNEWKNLRENIRSGSTVVLGLHAFLGDSVPCYSYTAMYIRSIHDQSSIAQVMIIGMV